MLQVSAPFRRLLAVAMLLAALSLLWSAVIDPILGDYGNARETVERLQEALERSRTGEHDIAALRAELDQLKQRQSSVGGFLQGANDSIAAAQLQNRLKTAVDAAKGELKSTQILASRDDGKFRRITVRGQLSVNMAALQRILYDLEAASPYLFLDNVEIKARSAARNRERSSEDPVLDVRFDVTGYMRRTT